MALIALMWFLRYVRHSWYAKPRVSCIAQIPQKEIQTVDSFCSNL